jgi:hypothetical protein
MADRNYHLAGIAVFECGAGGHSPRGDRDAVDLISSAASSGARLVIIPTGRLGDAFFDLKTRIAGEFLQKFVTYGVQVAILGDISRYVAQSTALRDFVYESNQGRHIWFVADLSDLEARLAKYAQSASV